MQAALEAQRLAELNAAIPAQMLEARARTVTADCEAREERVRGRSSRWSRTSRTRWRSLLRGWLAADAH